jgi:hypothetical protein
VAALHKTGTDEVEHARRFASKREYDTWGGRKRGGY